MAIDKEMDRQRVLIKGFKLDITPGDKTNNSLLARNAIRRTELKIVDLEIELKELKKEAYNF